MASLAGIVALGGAPAYAVSKDLSVGLAKQIELYYAKDRIRCNSVCPSCESWLFREREIEEY